jgi:O-antigen ligase
VALLVAVPLFGLLAERILGPDQGAAYSRVPLMRLAERIISASPWTGVGANNFAQVMPQYATAEFDTDWLYTVHNAYLLIWAEAGIGALAAYLWFLLATIRRGWALVRRRDAFLSPIALGITAAIAGHALHMGVDLFNARVPMQLLWLLAALLVATEAVAAAEARGRALT